MSLTPLFFRASRGFAVRLRDGAQYIVQAADRGGAAAEGEAEQKLPAGMISVTSQVDVVFTLE